MRLPQAFAALLLGLVAVVALAGGEACTSSASSTGDCDTVCALQAKDCGGTSCLAFCIETQTACNVSGNSSAFNDWATSCGPSLTCDDETGQFAVAGCPLQEIELLACKLDGGSSFSFSNSTSSSGSASHTGSDAGMIIFPSKDAGDDDDANLDDRDGGADGNSEDDGGIEAGDDDTGDAGDDDTGDAGDDAS